MTKDAYQIAETRAKTLLKAIYAATRIDDIARDYNMVSAITKPAIGLVGCLANSGASRDTSYQRRGVGWGRSYLAEIKAVLTAAYEVGYLTHHFKDLTQKAADADQALVEIQGVLDARMCG